MFFSGSQFSQVINNTVGLKGNSNPKVLLGYFSLKNSILVSYLNLSNDK